MPFSEAKCSVFNAFKYSLGMGEIKGSNYKNLKVYLKKKKKRKYKLLIKV